MMQFIGLDISKNKCDVCWLKESETGKRKTKVIKNTQAGHESLKNWLQATVKAAPEHMVLILEPTGVYHESIMYFLHDHGFNILLANPGKAKQYAESINLTHKTDKSDAFMLANYGCAQQSNLALWQPEAKEIRVLKALLRRLDTLESDRQRELNRLDSSEFSLSSERVVLSLKDMICTLESEIEKLKQDINNHINGNPQLKRNRALLESIPGIGPVLSRELTYLFAAKQFSNARQVGAYAGLIPKLHESGKLKGRTTLTKTGPAKLRAKLYMAAIVAGRYNVSVRLQKEALLKRGKTSMQVLGANMRKLVQICYGVIKNQQEYQPQVI
ncbi:IS110 family transposase [Pseudoalteromonas sp. YIC-827]|uniref:IS110 family transposase n=2 Tax=Pseudoalteromonas qingdaonensis TaxID=3131913 RepID=A0ABU9MYT1_9GAMM